jgi:hypothetical protein
MVLRNESQTSVVTIAHLTRMCESNNRRQFRRCLEMVRKTVWLLARRPQRPHSDIGQTWRQVREGGIAHACVVTHVNADSDRIMSFCMRLNPNASGTVIAASKCRTRFHIAFSCEVLRFGSPMQIVILT